MFFKKNKDDSVGNKEKEIVLSDDIKERYARSGYQEKKSLTTEDVYFLFCDKKDWSTCDPETGGDNEKFIKAIKHIYYYKMWFRTNYNNIIFPEISSSIEDVLLKSKPLFSDCIFQGSFHIQAKESTEAKVSDDNSFDFKNCVFFDSFELSEKGNIVISDCFYHGSISIISPSEVTISKTNAEGVKVSCEELRVSDSDFKEFLFCKTGRITEEFKFVRDRPINTVIERTVFGELILDTKDSELAQISIKDSSIDTFAQRSSKTKLNIVSIKSSNLGKVEQLSTNSYINFYKTEIKEFFKIRSKKGIEFIECVLSNQTKDLTIYTDSEISFYRSNMSGCNLSVKASNIEVSGSKIKDLSLIIHNPECSVRFKESEFRNITLNSKKITAEKCTISSIFYKGKDSITISITDSNIERIGTDQLRSAYFRDTNIDCLQVTGIDKKTFVEIKKSEIQKKYSFICCAKTRIEGSIFNEDISIHADEVKIYNSTINNKLNIRLEYDSSGKDIVLIGNDIGSLDISECLINGKITLWYNTIKERLSLYRSRARQLEIENTTVSGKCDLSYLDIDRLCILKSCRFSDLLDLSFSYIAYLAFHGSNLRKLNMDCLFYKDIKVFDTKGLDADGVPQELSDENFATKESGRLFQQLPHVTTVTTESDEDS